MLRFSLISIAVFLISGCAVYPTTRTYFEPNTEDGAPTRSASCGYHVAANDSLERQIGGVSVVVSPRYKQGDNLSLTVSFHFEEEDVEIDETSIIVTVNGEHSYFPKNVIVNSYKKDRTHANRIFLNLIYPVQSESIVELSVMLPRFLNKHIRPFRFKKTTKSDIYYASINC